MKSYSFDTSMLSATDKEAFKEASAEELRVLIALIECGGKASAERLAQLSGTSHARAASAVVFWEGAGVLVNGNGPSITHEFEPRAERVEFYSQTREQTASTIRNRGLRDLIDECARMLEKTSLSDSEVHKITTLSSEYALSEEFILSLANYLFSGGRFSVTRLFDEAVSLVKEKVDTPALLDEYIKNTESEAGYMRELRRTLGIKGRALSATEKELFSKWSVKFGYSPAIIGEAYDITVMSTGERSLQYMDTILTRWHENNCKTVAQCRALSEQDRAKIAEKKRAISADNNTRKKKTDEPKYLSFDPNEALRRAIERSYKNPTDGEK